MKKINKILAVASTVMFLTCTVGVETQAKVTLNEKGVPVKLEYSSEAPSSDEIFQDMQVLEDYIQTKVDCSGFKTASERTLRWESEYCYKLRGFDPKKAKSLATKMSFKDDTTSFNALSAINAEHEELHKYYYSRTIEENEVGTCRAIIGWIREMLKNIKINYQIIESDTDNFRYNHGFIAYQIPDSGDIWYVLPCGGNPKRRKLKDLTFKNYFCDLYEYYEKNTNGKLDFKLYTQPKFVGQDITWWKSPIKGTKNWNVLLGQLNDSLVPYLFYLNQQKN